MPLNGSDWTPSRLTRFVRSFGTAMSTALVETDRGLGYLKGVGNPSGPHQLACEWVGTSLADWFDAPTFDFALMDLLQDDEVPVHAGGRLSPGPAFVTRAEPKGFPWGGDMATLERINNPRVISQLVVLDTWTRNCDRHAPDGKRINRDNVFLKHDLDRIGPSLVVMDFSHSFSCGQDLSRAAFYIEKVKDEKIYGLFPEFRSFISEDLVEACASRLRAFSTEVATEIISQIPRDWEVSKELCGHWNRFLTERAHFLARNVQHIIRTQQRLEFREQK